MNNEFGIFKFKLLGLYRTMLKAAAGEVKRMAVEVNKLTTINNAAATTGIQSNKEINSTRRITKTREHLQEGITVGDILK